MIQTKFLLSYVVIGISAALLPLPLGASALTERWSQVEVAATPAGWVHETVTRDAEKVVTESTFHLEVRRGAAEIMFEIATRFVETPAGRPLQAWSRQLLGALPIETTWTFEEGDEEVRRATRQGDGPVREDVVPRPAGDWITPGRLEETLREHLAAGEESFDLLLLDPTLGLQVVENTWTLEERAARLEIDGVEHAVSRWRQSQSLVSAPGIESTVDLSADGVALRTATAMMGLEMTVTVSTREKILAATGDGRETALPELLVRSFVAPDRPLSRPRELRRAVYRLRSESALTAADFPSTAAQRVEQDDDGVRVIVDAGAAPAEEIDREVHLAASTYLDHRAEPLVELVKKALSGIAKGDGTSSDAERAEILRRFTSGHLGKKNLDTVLATATEVARTGSGDCTEHAVLLSALLRGAGIPSRVAIGLVYAESFAGENDVFVYHMWSQAYLEGRWVDLDATLPHPFDAAHIAIAATALDGDLGAFTEMARMTSLLGALRIEVEEPCTDPVCSGP